MERFTEWFKGLDTKLQVFIAAAAVISLVAIVSSL
jgi:hypothetical protein